MNPDDVAPLDGYDPEVGLLLAVMQDSTNEWRMEMLEFCHLWQCQDLPRDAILWQEAPGGISIGALMMHMMEAELWWSGEVIGGVPVSEDDRKRLRMDGIDQYEDRWPKPLDLDLKGYFDLMDEVRARTLAVVKNETATRICPRPNPEERGATVRWILGHLAQHEAYHGGQAVSLMKRWKQKCGVR